MTVYVDNFRAPATVGRVKARWSHLTADSPDELHEFAARLGHRRDWFQARCKSGSCPAIDGVCAHFHYDVVDRKRTQAIALGAQPIDIREMGAIVTARRSHFRAPAAGTSTTRPAGRPVSRAESGKRPGMVRWAGDWPGGDAQ